MVKLKTVKVCVFIIVLTGFLAVFISKNQNPKTSNYTGEYGITNVTQKNVLLVMGNQSLSVNGTIKNGFVPTLTSGKKYVWYNQDWCKEFVEKSKTHSHDYQAVSTNAYLLECNTCGEKSFDYEYLSENWQKIKGVKERLDSSMVIVYIPSDNP